MHGKSVPALNDEEPWAPWAQLSSSELNGECGLERVEVLRGEKDSYGADELGINCSVRAVKLQNLIYKKVDAGG